MKTSISFKEVVLLIDSGKLQLNELVTILQLTISNIDIDTVSETARKEGKSPNGINKSKQYRKIKIGKQKMVIKGLSDSELPF